VDALLSLLAAAWGKGRFDPERLIVGLLLVVPAILAVVIGLRGGK